MDTVTRATYSSPVGAGATISTHAVVSGMSMFNGAPALTVTETSTFDPNAVLMANMQRKGTTTAVRYLAPDSGAASFREFGYTSTLLTADPSGSLTTTVVNDPYVESRFTLAVNASFDQRYTQTFTTYSPAQTAPVSTKRIGQEINVRFNGMTPVTVPAGTFDTCEFIETAVVTDASYPGGRYTRNSTIWLGAGSGVIIKSVVVGTVVTAGIPTATTSTFELLSGSVDGNPVPR